MSERKSGSYEIPEPFNTDEYTGKFRGDNGMLIGYVQQTQSDVIVDGLNNPLIPKGSAFLEIHFDTKERNIYDGELSKVRKTLRRGASDLLDLSYEMENRKKLKDVQLVVGTTNPRLAHLAVRKLGFHYFSKDSSEDEATIYITRDQLLSHSEDVKNVRRAIKKNK